MSLTFEEFVRKIQRGTIFTIHFRKRTAPHEERTINCRINADNKLKGGDLKYNPLEKDLFVVFDMQKQDFRQIPIEGIISLTMGGHTYLFNREKKEFEE
jgi:hypothetical protein